MNDDISDDLFIEQERRNDEWERQLEQGGEYE